MEALNIKLQKGERFEDTDDFFEKILGKDSSPKTLNSQQRIWHGNATKTHSNFTWFAKKILKPYENNGFSLFWPIKAPQVRIPKMDPKWSQNGPQLDPKLTQN